ncbi:hypothetical protein Hanom_Chr15g01382071 [Helianthus anomalus]
MLVRRPSWMLTWKREGCRGGRNRETFWSLAMDHRSIMFGLHVRVMPGGFKRVLKGIVYIRFGLKRVLSK